MISLYIAQGEKKYNIYKKRYDKRVYDILDGYKQIPLNGLAIFIGDDEYKILEFDEPMPFSHYYCDDVFHYEIAERYKLPPCLLYYKDDLYVMLIDKVLFTSEIIDYNKLAGRKLFCRAEIEPLLDKRVCVLDTLHANQISKALKEFNQKMNELQIEKERSLVWQFLQSEDHYIGYDDVLENYNIISTILVSRDFDLQADKIKKISDQSNEGKLLENSFEGIVGF